MEDGRRKEGRKQVAMRGRAVSERAKGEGPSTAPARGSGQRAAAAATAFRGLGVRQCRHRGAGDCG